MENLWQCLLCALFCPVVSEPSTRVDLDFIIWSWKEVERTATGASWKVLGNLRTPISGGPVDGLEGGQKGLNDVEAKGVPRQFMARERTVMKQNFWASRLNSRESECDCLSPLLFIEFLPPQDSLGHWNSLLTRIFLVSLGPVQGKANTKLTVSRNTTIFQSGRGRNCSREYSKSSRSTVGSKLS